jgi:hypothetical protein
MFTRLMTSLWRNLREPEMLSAPQSYEYKLVSIDVRLPDMSNIQQVLDQYSADQWRVVDTIISDGVTRALIFERSLLDRRVDA